MGRYGSAATSHGYHELYPPNEVHSSLCCPSQRSLQASFPDCIIIVLCFRRANVLPTEEARLQLWHKYLKLQVFNQLCPKWAKLMLIPSIASITSTIIICFYGTIRNEERPLWLALFFLYDGLTIFSLVFWVCYQAILMIRGSEEIIKVLKSFEVKGRHDGRVGASWLTMRK